MGRCTPPLSHQGLCVYLPSNQQGHGPFHMACSCQCHQGLLCGKTHALQLLQPVKWYRDKEYQGYCGHHTRGTIPTHPTLPQRGNRGLRQPQWALEPLDWLIQE